MITVRLISYDSDDYKAEIALRYRILREPLGLSFTKEQLAREAGDTHIAAFDGERLIGCLVLTPSPPDSVHMRQVAVEPEFQGQGVGKRLVLFSEQQARQSGYSRMILHARETAVPFYLKLGYELVGEPFIEVTIPHRLMQKSL